MLCTTCPRTFCTGEDTGGGHTLAGGCFREEASNSQWFSAIDNDGSDGFLYRCSECTKLDGDAIPPTAIVSYNFVADQQRQLEEKEDARNDQDSGDDYSGDGASIDSSELTSVKVLYTDLEKVWNGRALQNLHSKWDSDGKKKALADLFNKEVTIESLFPDESLRANILPMFEELSNQSGNETKWKKISVKSIAKASLHVIQHLHMQHCETGPPNCEYCDPDVHPNVSVSTRVTRRSTVTPLITLFELCFDLAKVNVMSDLAKKKRAEEKSLTAPKSQHIDNWTFRPNMVSLIVVSYMVLDMYQLTASLARAAHDLDNCTSLWGLETDLYYITYIFVIHSLYVLQICTDTPCPTCKHNYYQERYTKKELKELNNAKLKKKAKDDKKKTPKALENANKRTRFHPLVQEYKCVCQHLSGIYCPECEGEEDDCEICQCQCEMGPHKRNHFQALATAAESKENGHEEDTGHNTVVDNRYAMWKILELGMEVSDVCACFICSSLHIHTHCLCLLLRMVTGTFLLVELNKHTRQLLALLLDMLLNHN